MSEVNKLTKQLEEAKESIVRRDEALQLYKNPLFKKLVIDEFCTQECAKYVHLSGDPALRPEEREDSLKIAQAAGHFRRYMSAIIAIGTQNENMLDRLEAEIEEARAEEAAD